MKKLYVFLLASLILMISCMQEEKPDYRFDGSISEEVLNNYLDRSITASELLVDQKYSIDGRYPDKEEDYRLIRELGVKFVGRSIFRWGKEAVLNDPGFLSHAKSVIDDLHAYDPDIIFQAAVFEAIYNSVGEVRIPARVFEAYGLPVENRCFSYEQMMPADGKPIRNWGGGGTVPDITRTESQLWFYYLMTSYIDAGIEAFHLGQIHKIGAHDENWDCYAVLLGKVREYAAEHARRHYVLFDAHTTVGMIRNGISLLDFDSYPMRPVEVEGQPMKGELRLDPTFIYGRKVACTAPSGWKTEALPYLVEVDNYGIGANPGQFDPGTRIWGYDEISWFYLLSGEEKEDFLRYAYKWIAETDPKGHLQMPVARVITTEKGRPTRVARAIARTETCPTGMGIESVIDDLWNNKNKE